MFEQSFLIREILKLSKRHREFYPDLVRLVVAITRNDTIHISHDSIMADQDRIVSIDTLVGRVLVRLLEGRIGYKLLHYASREGKLNLILDLLSKGEDVSVGDSQDSSPLHYAAKNGQLDAVKLLLDNKANILARNKDGKTALDLARVNNKVEVERFLVEKLNMFLFSAVQAGDLAGAANLLKGGADIEAKDRNGNTPLYVAAESNQSAVVELLLDNRAKIENLSIYNRTALHIACKKGYFDVAKKLVDRGGNVNAKANGAWTPLHDSIRENGLAIVKLLVDKGADISAKLTDGTKPFGLAEKNNLQQIKDFLVQKQKEYDNVLLNSAKVGDLSKVLEFIKRGANVNAASEQGWQSIHLAAMYGHLEIVKELIEVRADTVMATDVHKHIGLHHAAMFGRLEVLEYLVQKNALSINATDDEMNTPLHFAAKNGQLDAVKLLLDNKANILARNKDGKTALDLARVNNKVEVERFLVEKLNMFLFSAVQAGDLAGAANLLKGGADIEAKDRNGNTPLYVAAESNQSAVVELLLDNRAKIENLSIYNRTALHIACKKGYFDVAKKLVDRGGNVNAKANGAWTPLHDSIRENGLAIVKLLVDKGADISAKLTDGTKPFGLAEKNNLQQIKDFLVQKQKEYDNVLLNSAKVGDLSKVLEFIKRGANVNAASEQGWQSIHLAAMYGHLEIVKELIEVRADTVMATDVHKHIGLHHAAMFGRLEVLEYLVQKNALSINATDDEMNTPLHFAAKNGQLDAVKLLLDNKANILARNKDGKTALDLARVNNKVEVERFLVEKLNMFLFSAVQAGDLAGAANLLKGGADIEAKDRNGNTPLYVAAESNQSAVVELLLDNRAKIENLSIYNRTALHIACKKGYFDVAKKLVDRGGNVNAKANGAWTPLHDSIRENGLAIVKLLVDKGADISAKLTDGTKPFGLAEKNNLQQIKDFLVQKQKEYDNVLLNSAKVGDLSKVLEFIKRGANVNAASEQGWQSIHLAAMYGHLEIVKELTEVRADTVMATDVHKHIGLHHAAMFGRLEVLEYLVQKNALSINATDDEMNTPLHFAAKNGQLDAVKLLLDNKANILARNKDGKTALDLARVNNKVEVERFLVEKLNMFLFSAVQAGDLAGAANLLKGGADIEAKDRNGNTPLYVAAESNQSAVVELLLDNRAKIENLSIYNRTALHIACKKGYFDVAKKLVDRGGNVNAKANGAWTPLHDSIRENGLAIVKLLVDKGADISAKLTDGTKPFGLAEKNNLQQIKDFLVQKQKEYDNVLLNSAKVGDLSKVLEFIKRGANVNAASEQGWQSIHLAAMYGHLEIVKELIEVRADTVMATDVHKHIGLHHAAMFGRLEVLEYLVQKNALSINATDDEMNTPLHFAAKNGQLDAVRLLLANKANILARNRDDKTALDLANESNKFGTLGLLIHKAVEQGKLDLVKSFLKNTAEKVDVEDKDEWKAGWTLLHYAAYNGKPNIIQSMFNLPVERRGNINSQDDRGYTPLHLSVYYNRSSVVNFFIDQGAGLEIQNNIGDTPLHVAARIGRSDVLKRLLIAGANISAKNKGSQTAREVADRSGQLIVRDFLKKKENEYILMFDAVGKEDLDKIRELLDNGANINARNDLDRVPYITPLHYAVREGKLKSAALLLDRGADIELRESYLWTPLHYAAYYDKAELEMAALLIEKGADIEAKTGIVWDINKRHYEVGSTPLDVANISGKRDVADLLREKKAQENSNWSPLHYAAGRGNKQLAVFMIENGANIEAKDMNNSTPLLYAVYNNRLDMVKFLVDKGANINARNNLSQTPLEPGRSFINQEIISFLREKENERLIQRERRHHHGDHPRHYDRSSRRLLAPDLSNQPEVVASQDASEDLLQNNEIVYNRGKAASGASKTSLWVGGLFSWAKGKGSLLMSGVVNSLWPASMTEETSYDFTTQNNLDSIDYSHVDMNGTVLLLDIFIRKITGQKYASTADQPISLLEAQGYALNIVGRFGEVVKQTALKSSILTHRLDIDFVKVQEEVTRKITGGKFNEIAEILNSYVEKACPGREAGCPGKLSPRKFDKFMAEFNKGLDAALNQPMQQILSKDSTLKGSNVKEQQISLEPRSYLNDASVQVHLTQTKGLRNQGKALIP